MKHTSLLSISLLSAILLVSCSKESLRSELSFSVDASPMQTRSSNVVDNTGDFITEFGQFKVQAYNGGTKVLDCLSRYLLGRWSPSVSYLWPASTTLDIYSWAPDTLALAVNAGQKSMSLTGISVSDPLTQKDNMLSFYSGQGNMGTAYMKFVHMFSAVKVELDGIGDAQVSSISVTGLKSTGNLSVDCTQTPLALTWSGQSGNSSFTPSVNDVAIILPQDAPSATMTVSLNDAGTALSFPVSLSDYDFRPGVMTVFRLKYYRNGVFTVRDYTTEQW